MNATLDETDISNLTPRTSHITHHTSYSLTLRRRRRSTFVKLLTCYDLRFPEPSLSLRRRGAEIITYPSAFTIRTGLAHWQPLLQARAIETQSYVVAAAQSGQHPDTNRTSYGRAMIVDPWGVVVAQCSDASSTKETFALADIVSPMPASSASTQQNNAQHSPPLLAGPRRSQVDSHRDATMGSAQT